MEVETRLPSEAHEVKRDYWPIINLRMPPECLQQLKDYAEKHFIGVSAVIRTTLLDAGIITAPDSTTAK